MKTLAQNVGTSILFGVIVAVMSLDSVITTAAMILVVADTRKTMWFVTSVAAKGFCIGVMSAVMI